MILGGLCLLSWDFLVVNEAFCQYTFMYPERESFLNSKGQACTIPVERRGKTKVMNMTSTAGEQQLIAELYRKEEELLAGFDEDEAYFLKQAELTGDEKYRMDAQIMRSEKERWEAFFESAREE